MKPIAIVSAAVLLVGASAVAALHHFGVCDSCCHHDPAATVSTSVTASSCCGAGDAAVFVSAEADGCASAADEAVLVSETLELECQSSCQKKKCCDAVESTSDE